MKVLDWLSDLLFPISCVICGRERTWLCATCAGAVERRPFGGCPGCEQVGTGGRICGGCRASSSLSGLAAAAPYRDPAVRGLIHGLKYDRARSAIAAIAGIIRRSNTSSRIPSADMIVPLPLYHRKSHDRGFNQSELIAQVVSQEIDTPIQTAVLVRRKNTRPQAHQDIGERGKNIKDAFLVRHPERIGGKRILLVDDVFTTGSTMREAARVLRAAGAAEVWGFAVAYG